MKHRGADQSLNSPKPACPLIRFFYSESSQAIERKRTFRWRCWNNPGKAMDRLVNTCAVKVPVLVAIMHIVGEVGGKPHLYSIDHFTMDGAVEKVMSRQ